MLFSSQTEVKVYFWLESYSFYCAILYFIVTPSMPLWWAALHPASMGRLDVIQVRSEINVNLLPFSWGCALPPVNAWDIHWDGFPLHGEVCTIHEINTSFSPQGMRLYRNKSHKNCCWLFLWQPMGILCNWDLGPQCWILQWVVYKSQV